MQEEENIEMDSIFPATCSLAGIAHFSKVATERAGMLICLYFKNNRTMEQSPHRRGRPSFASRATVLYQKRQTAATRCMLTQGKAGEVDKLKQRLYMSLFNAAAAPEQLA